jgi:hypothetical protein
MLKLLRSKHVAKFIFWSLVVLILPAFVLWGTGSLGRSKSKGPKYVGTIDGKKVSFEDFFENILGIRTQILMNYFTNPQLVDSLLKDRTFVAKMAWDRLIMLSEAEKRDLKITDQELIYFIRNHPMFVRNGIFDERLYGYILRNNMGLDARQFEEITRENLKLQKLNEILAKDIKATDDEALDEYKAELAKSEAGESKAVDEAAFQKEKDKYLEKALEKKRNAYLEKWLKDVHGKAVLNIDLADVEKYYR